jgi:3-methyladenine DNA glycosylase/8-oxoguanine DNA glycosylase
VRLGIRRYARSVPARAISPRFPIDLAATLFPLRRGIGDPTTRIEGDEAVRAILTPEGAATLRLSARAGRIAAESWGPGAAWALETAPGLVGAEDDDSGFDPRHDAIAEIWHRHHGVRISRSRDVMPALVGAILEQKVTGAEARAIWRRMVRAIGEPAPGPVAGLLLPPDPGDVAVLPYFAFHPLGLERRRADVIRAACARRGWFEACRDLPLDEAKARLEAIPGIGPWTVAEVARTSLGDPDALSVGDYHLPHLVSWTLAGEPRGNDERMLELLEPYRGQRGRVQRLLESGAAGPPRRGPRMPVRSIARI